MATKEHTVEHPILFNKHLKEWNNCLASEQESLYQLRCKHGIERDQLSFERITDTRLRLNLSIQQAQEIDQLKQQNNEIRLAILERQANERNNLKQAIC